MMRPALALAAFGLTLALAFAAAGAPSLSVSATPTLQAQSTPTVAPTPKPRKQKKQKKGKSKSAKKAKKVKSKKKSSRAGPPPAGTIPVPPPVPDACITDTTPGLQNLDCDGLGFRLNVPAICSSAACGLIADVHGFAMSGGLQDLHTNLAALAGAAAYIVVQPNAPVRGALPSWEASDDAALRAILERVIQVFHVQPERVHMTGYSQGAWMTWRFTCHSADLLASVAPLAGGAQSSGVGCFQSEFPPFERDVFYAHGTTDNFVPFSTALPLRDAILDEWKMDPELIVSSDAEHLWTRYENKRGTVFEFAQHDWETDLVFGAPLVGHCFPGSDAPIGCGADTAFHWGEEVLRFFQAHPLD